MYGYPTTQQTFPGQYPQQSGYPQPGYPPPPAQGYPSAPAPGYPPQQYSQPGYPPAPQPGYPAAPQPGYPSQPGYPPPPQQGYSTPGYPPQPAAYPGYAAPQPYAGRPVTQAAYPGYPSYGVPATTTVTGYMPVVTATPVYAQPVLYEMKFRGYKLDRMDLFSKSDPFILISATNKPLWANGVHVKFGRGRTMRTLVYKSETIHNNQNPSWAPFQIDVTLLCQNNIDQPFSVEVFDWDSDGSHQLIGRATTTLRELAVMKELKIKNPLKRNMPFYHSSGLLFVETCRRIN